MLQNFSKVFPYYCFYAIAFHTITLLIAFHASNVVLLMLAFLTLVIAYPVSILVTLFCITYHPHGMLMKLFQRLTGAVCGQWQAVFPLSRFFSANWRFVGARANNFCNIVNKALENSTNFWKYDIWYTSDFNTGLVQNLGHINVFLELWAQLF